MNDHVTLYEQHMKNVREIIHGMHLNGHYFLWQLRTDATDMEWQTTLNTILPSS